MKRVAITREVSASIVECELTHLDRIPIDLERARQQHAAYESALEELGCEIRRLPPLPSAPDAVFVEDAAVVTDEIAVLARPGSELRRQEVDSIEEVLSLVRRIKCIEEPGTLDGGDVLRIGRDIFVGRSARTNEAGIEQLRAHLQLYGYRVESVDLHGALHLKTAVSSISAGGVILNPDWVEREAFEDYEQIEVDPDEPFAANVLRVDDVVLMANAHPKTADRIRGAGLEVRGVDADELAKAEGGLTCCSVILHVEGR